MLYIILTGSLVAASCALLGSFLLLRKMSMVGDAISHAVLPGIVLAYLATGSRDSTVILLGAATVGMFATVMIEWLHKKARLQEDAAIGISFTWLFAIGVILVSRFGSEVDLDQSCVLYGTIENVWMDSWTPTFLPDFLQGFPRPVWILSGLLVMVVSYIVLAYHPLRLSSFDEKYAASLGIRTQFWHYSLMSLVSLTTVVSFESVGAILVIALLTGPPAAAYLITRQLKWMLILSVIFGVIVAILGYALAYKLDGSVAGAMAVIAGLEVGLAWLAMSLKGRFIGKAVIGS